MKSIEVKAKTLHEAIEDACTELGVPQEDLDIEVLSQGGMFGKVKILATIKESAEMLKPQSEQPVIEPTKPIIEKKESPKKPKEVEQKEKIDTTTHIEESKPTRTGLSKFVATKNFITKLLDLLENNSTVTIDDTDTAYNININGENIGRLIGKNGVVLNAIQTLVSSIAITNSNGEGKRVFINIGDYKEKRGNSLQTLAMKKAEYVKKSGRFVKLEPMNARERAIIHTTLSTVEGIKTYSTGRDPFRCLCIAPDDNKGENSI